MALELKALGGDVMVHFRIFVTLMLVFIPSAWGNPKDCDFEAQSSWPIPEELKESSGVAYDQERAWLYQVNDSGNEAAIWKTDIQGKKLQKISLEGIKNIDFEDVSIGACPGGSENKCFFVADIGDNLQSRRDDQIHTIHLFDLKGMSTSLSMKPLSSIPLIYPDRIHNAESLAIHPHYPYAYILTKEYEGILFKTVMPAKLFRLDLSKDQSLPSDGKPILLTEVGTIDIGTLAGSSSALPTAMEFSPDGEWLYILTYKNVVVIKNTGWANLSAPFPVVWERDQNFFVIQIEEQKQMEALAFISNDQFVVTSEGKKGKAIIYNCRPKALPHQ
ncbi:MAG: hypothetical protein AABY86_10155 [Bdellovibrionota bacterium]